MEKLSKFESALILGLAKVIDQWAAFPLPNTRSLIGRNAWREYRANKHEKDLAVESIATLDVPAFLDIDPTPTESTMACRAWKRMESLGLVNRLSSKWSDRTSQVQLTPAGRSWVTAHTTAQAAA